MQLSTTSVDNNTRTSDHAIAVDPLQARVDAAAFSLLREGRNPTVALVRARMGGASPNVVAPALQRWRLTFAGQLDANAASALEVLPPGVLELVQALWSRALFEAHRVRADARSTADALEQLNDAISALRDQAARLQEREAVLDAELHALHEQRRAPAHAYIKESSSAPRRGAQPHSPPAKRNKPKKRKAAATAPDTSRSGRTALRGTRKLSRRRSLRR